MGGVNIASVTQHAQEMRVGFWCRQRLQLLGIHLQVMRFNLKKQKQTKEMQQKHRSD